MYVLKFRFSVSLLGTRKGFVQWNIFFNKLLLFSFYLFFYVWLINSTVRRSIFFFAPCFLKSQVKQEKEVLPEEFGAAPTNGRTDGSGVSTTPFDFKH